MFETISMKAMPLLILAGLLLSNDSRLGADEDLPIINSDFEKTSFLRKAPLGWKTWIREGHDAQATFGVDSRISYQGKRSVRIVNQGYGDCCYCLKENILLSQRANALFRIDGYIRCQDVEGAATIKVFTVDANGQKDWKVALATTAGSHEWRLLSERFVIASEVVELGLQLELVGPGTAWFDHLSLQRIEWSPLETYTVQGRDFIELPPVIREASPDFGKEQRAKGYVIFLTPDPDDVFRDMVPQREQIDSTIELFVAQNEYQPAVFNIYALRELQHVSIRVTDLIDAEGNKIPDDFIDTHTVQYWPQRLSWNSRSYHVIPELLEQQGVTDIPGRKSQQFWLIVHIPSGTTPGRYHATVIVAADNADSSHLALKVNVWPFELTTPPQMVWGLYVDNRRWERYTTKQLVAELEDIKAHGINGILLNPLSADRITMGSNGIEIDLSQVDSYMKVLRDVGFQGPVVFSIQGLDTILLQTLQERRCEDTFAEEYQKVVRKLMIAAEESDWPQIWYQAVDEPANSEQKKGQAIRLYKLLKEIGCGTFTTADVIFCNQVLDPWLDVRCYNINYVGKTADQCAQRRAEAEASDDLFWWYGSGCYPEQEGKLFANRHLTGFLFWKTGASGQWSWTFQRPYGDPYNDFDGIAKDACITYPAKTNEVSISTLQWEGIRQGIDDARYVYTLETMIEERLHSSDRKIREKAVDAERRLTELMDDVPWMYEEEFSNADADSLRRKIAQMILELNS
jgi:hypothetical protein